VVVASQQPTQQGRVDGAAIYFFPISDNPYGWQGRAGQYDSGSNEVIYQETQRYETTYQVTALAPSDPNDLSLPTPKDLVSLARMIIGSQKFVSAMTAQKVGVQRPTPIRNPFFNNDRDQFEASPSFDFTVSHERSIIQQVPAVESVELNQIRV
jgi:hypothetical protein